VYLTNNLIFFAKTYNIITKQYKKIIPIILKIFDIYTINSQQNIIKLSDVFIKIKHIPDNHILIY
jgi:hypothetical protein